MTRRQPIIAYVRPDRGGIADYARQIEAIYSEQGYQLEIHNAPTAAALAGSSADLLHFEIGAGDGELFAMSRALLRTNPNKPQLLTIHDPGVVVRHPIPVHGAGSTLTPVRVVAKIIRKLISRTLGSQIITRHLRDPRITALYLREDCVNGSNAYYLPQPTYHRNAPTIRRKPLKTVGFSGYWDVSKGLETLLFAWEQLEGKTDLKLVVAGATADAGDPYAKRIQRIIQQMNQPVEMVGFLPAGGMDDFLRSLGVLVLPYWPSLPNGTSAMALRAIELGVPIIASDVPALRHQVGGSFLVPPKDITALTGAIQQFSKEPTEFTKQALALQKAVFTTNGWDTVGTRLTTIISKIEVSP